MKTQTLKNAFLFPLILLIADGSAYYLSLFCAFFTRVSLESILGLKEMKVIGLHEYLSWWWMPLTFSGFLFYEKVYSRRFPIFDELKAIVKAVSFSTIGIFAMLSIAKFSNATSRLVLILLFFYALVFFVIIHYSVKRLCFKFGIGLDNVLILGAGNTGYATASEIMKEKNFGYKVIGFLDDKYSTKFLSKKVHGIDIPVLGKVKNFDTIVKQNLVRTVMVALPSVKSEKLSAIISDIQRYVPRLLVVPDLRGIGMLNSELYHLFDEQLFLIKVSNNMKSILNRTLKRILDISLAIIILPFTLPFLLLVAILIRIDSRGRAFFIQKRLARGFQSFYCIKFRTMFINADKDLEVHLAQDPAALEQWQHYRKLKGHDPRVTRVGRFLRKTSLDELPQIINVLLGDMSFVGPRPYIESEVTKHKETMETILLTRPGITGLWQTSGRNQLTFKKRLALDYWYVLNWSLWLDLFILLKTIKIVLRRDGAY